VESEVEDLKKLEKVSDRLKLTQKEEKDAQTN